MQSLTTQNKKNLNLWKTRKTLLNHTKDRKFKQSHNSIAVKFWIYSWLWIRCLWSRNGSRIGSRYWSRNWKLNKKDGTRVWQVSHFSHLEIFSWKTDFIFGIYVPKNGILGEKKSKNYNFRFEWKNARILITHHNFRADFVGTFEILLFTLFQ